MTVDTEPIEVVAGELVRYEPPPPPSTLFHTDDPLEVVERAARAADALKRVLDKQRLTKTISGREHVLVEGWTTLGSMLGVVPVVIWSRKVEPATRYDVEVINYEWVTVNDRQVKREKSRSTYDVDGHDWEARVEVRTLDGRMIGAAEALCSRKEHTWAKRDDYALRSMAQTRATSKALRGPLGFVVSLAGYAPVPAEELADDDAPHSSSDGPRPTGVVRAPTPSVTADPPKATERTASAPQKRKINAKASEKALAPLAFLNILRVASGVEPLSSEDITDERATQATSRLVDRLPARLVTAVLKGIDQAEVF